VITTGIVLGGRYALGAPLGSGGMADVYEAVDRTTGDGVAVKVVRGVEPSMRKRIEAEARALERLDHPALVALRDVGEHDGAPFLVLDLVRGRCLADVLGDGPLGVERSVEIVAPVAEGLAHAHDLGIVHRDVKPANVLVDEDGRAHLADFGIARIADLTGLTRTGQVIGSASYLAPEQLRGDEVGPPADVFALGLVLLECITGRRAFDGSPTESAMARLVRSPVVPDDVPAWCR
jgi:serine/threonine protein kinase